MADTLVVRDDVSKPVEKSGISYSKAVQKTQASRVGVVHLRACCFGHGHPFRYCPMTFTRKKSRTFNSVALQRTLNAYANNSESMSTGRLPIAASAQTQPLDQAAVFAAYAGPLTDHRTRMACPLAIQRQAGAADVPQ